MYGFEAFTTVEAIQLFTKFMSIIVAFSLLLLIIILVLHTLTVFGAKLMYRKRRPVNGWNKRFYPVILLQIVICALSFILMRQMW